MSPPYGSAAPETRWEKYGEGNGGRGDQRGGEYCFITMDTRGYETVDQLWINCLCAT